jgi:hypothetical protein
VNDLLHRHLISSSISYACDHFHTGMVRFVPL